MKHMTLTAMTAALLVSTSAFAMDMKASSEASIDSLPDKGAVSLSGTVDRVVDGDTFILRDSKGETIDVHTAANVNVNKGDMISVKGDKTAEVAGIGEEINNASITLSGEVKKMTSNAKDTVKNTTGAVAGAVGALASANVDANTKARVEMKNQENTESPSKASDNTDTKKTAAYDIDVDVDTDAQKVANAGEAQTKEVQTPKTASNNTEAKKTAAYDVDVKVDAEANKVASAGEMTAGEATRFSNDKAEKAADKVASTMGKAQGTIGALPKEGAAELNGVVAEVDNDQTFTLRDSEGKTIEVNTASNVEVQPGDTVSVNGNVKSKLLGLGREIESAKVLVVSAAR